MVVAEKQYVSLHGLLLKPWSSQSYLNILKVYKGSFQASCIPVYVIMVMWPVKNNWSGYENGGGGTFVLYLKVKNSHHIALIT